MKQSTPDPNIMAAIDEAAKSGSEIQSEELRAELLSVFARTKNALQSSTAALERSQASSRHADRLWLLVKIFLKVILPTFFTAFLAAAAGWVEIPILLPLPVNGMARPLSAADAIKAQPFKGKYQPTHRLSTDNVQHLFSGLVDGPEHGVLNGTTMWTLSSNGTIYSAELLDLDKGLFGDIVEEGFVGPGRPLGFTLSPSSDSIYICNSLQGLLSWERSSGVVTILANRVTKAPGAKQSGELIAYANSVDISPTTGKAYFTSSGSIPPMFNRLGLYDTMKSSLLIFLSGWKDGMLLEYDFETRTVTCLVDGIFFANGVSVAADGSYVLYVETHAISLHKYWLQGPKAGTSEVLLERLPAVPDNLVRQEDGSFWLAFVIRPPPVMTAGPVVTSTFVRSLLAKAPAWMRPPLPKIAGGIQLTGDGAVTKVAVDLTGTCASTTTFGAILTSAVTQKPYLLMGSLHTDEMYLADLTNAEINKV